MASGLRFRVRSAYALGAGRLTGPSAAKPPAWGVRHTATSLRIHNGVAGNVRALQQPLLWLPEDGQASTAALRPHDFLDCSARAIEAREMLRELRDCGAVLLSGYPGADEQPQLLERLGDWLGGSPLEQPAAHDFLGGPGPVGELSRAGTFLHMPQAAVTVLLGNGASTSPVLRLVDGFAAAKALQESSPAAFEYLSTRPLPWRQGFRVKRTLAPILQLRTDGTPEILRWSLGELEELAPSARSELQPHAAALAALLASGRFERRLRLRPGEILLLDNQRVLFKADGTSVSAGMPVLRFGRDDVERAMRLCGLLPPLPDNGITSPKARILRSPGLGYFAVAAAPLAEGEPLFSVDLTVPDGRLKTEPSLYSIQVSEDQHMLPTLVPDELGGLIRYPSHMSNPSLKIRLSPGTVELVARHRIDVGEELGWNYCSTEWSMASPFTDARTKAQIQGFRYLQKEEQQWLMTEGLVAPHLKRLVAQQP